MGLSRPSSKGRSRWGRKRVGAADRGGGVSDHGRGTRVLLIKIPRPGEGHTHGADGGKTLWNQGPAPGKRGNLEDAPARFGHV